jgi:hypothetical protein
MIALSAGVPESHCQMDVHRLVVVVSEFTYDGKRSVVPFVVGPSMLKDKVQDGSVRSRSSAAGCGAIWAMRTSRSQTATTCSTAYAAWTGATISPS